MVSVQDAGTLERASLQGVVSRERTPETKVLPEKSYPPRSAYLASYPADLASGAGTWNPPSSSAIKRANSMVR